MKFTDIFIRRPVLAVSISLLIILLGLQAISKLAVDLEIGCARISENDHDGDYGEHGLPRGECKLNSSVCDFQN